MLCDTYSVSQDKFICWKNKVAIKNGVEFLAMCESCPAFYGIEEEDIIIIGGDDE